MNALERFAYGVCEHAALLLLPVCEWLDVDPFVMFEPFKAIWKMLCIGAPMAMFAFMYYRLGGFLRR